MALKLPPTLKKQSMKERLVSGYGTIMGCDTKGGGAGGGGEGGVIEPKEPAALCQQKGATESKSLRDVITFQAKNTEMTLNYSDLDKMGTHSVKVKCFSCRSEVQTDVYVHAGPVTWGLCLMLIPTCFCWLPFAIDGCQEGVHKCPECHAVIGVQKQC